MMRDDVEQLEFLGIEQHNGLLVAHMRNLNRCLGGYTSGSDWFPGLRLLELRYSKRNWREPRRATKAALDALIAAHLEKTRKESP
jgi:hypothetical protein